MGSDKHPVRRHPIPSSRPPFPIPRESCCTFPRRAPSRQSNANTALIRGTRPPKYTFRKLFKPLPLDDASFDAILPRALAVCVSSSSSSTTEHFDAIYGDECAAMGADLFDGGGIPNGEDRFTVELREIRTDYYFPISIVDFEFLFRRVTFAREFLNKLRLNVNLIFCHIYEGQWMIKG